MTPDEARDFIKEHHRCVLATRRRDGGVQQSPVLVALDGDGHAVVSSREGAMKTINLRRNPTATLLVLSDGFWGQWVTVEGPCEIVSLPAAMDGLVAYYRGVSGEHPDWDDYRAAMERERRVLLRVAIERAGPNREG